jgi:hypothetical protein
MKTTSYSHKHFQSMLATLAIAITCGLSVRPAQADYIVTLLQVGPNVVATGSGTIDWTGLTLQSSSATGPAANIQPQVAVIVTGQRANPKVDIYTGFTGPTNFGSGGFKLADFGSGDQVGVRPTFDELFVPAGYVSGSPLVDSSTYNNATFSSLGVTPGTYVWTWGTGVDADSFTLQIGPAAVPDSGSTLGLLLVSLLALVGVSRFRSRLA